MKGIYITLILVTVIVVIMIALAFFYIDQQRHQVFLYAIYHGDTLVGYEKFDKYVLENSQIYKSYVELPRDMLNRQFMRKITFEVRGKHLLNYEKEVLTDGVKSVVSISNSPEKTSFIAIGHADFSYLDRVPTGGNDLVFETRAIVTYPPLIRRYNFKKRNEQFVNTIIPASTVLPPMREIVSVTSIGRDTIEIEGRDVNCERLVLKLKNGDLISVWVTGGFHNVLMVDMPKYGFKAVLCGEKDDIPVTAYKRKNELYTEKEVTFTSEETSLYGTLSVPSIDEGPYPTVLLIWGEGAVNRDAGGIFVDMAHTLAVAGYCVLRFDKRGIGKSQGFFSTYAQPEEISDLKSAIAFLKSLPEVDKSRIALLGYSEGGLYAAHLAGSDEDVRACIIMSAPASSSPLKNDYAKLKMSIADDEYLESAIAAATQSREMIKEKSDWIAVMGKRVFTKKMNLEGAYDTLDAIKTVKVPVLILHGKKDSVNFIEEADELRDALIEAGNDDIATIYFGELDHLLGTMVKDPPIRDHIEVDIEVLKSLTDWLGKNLVPQAAQPPEPPEPPAEEPVVESADPEAVIEGGGEEPVPAEAQSEERAPAGSIEDIHEE